MMDWRMLFQGMTGPGFWGQLPTGAGLFDTSGLPSVTGPGATPLDADTQIGGGGLSDAQRLSFAEAGAVPTESGMGMDEMMGLASAFAPPKRPPAPGGAGISRMNPIAIQQWLEQAKLKRYR